MYIHESSQHSDEESALFSVTIRDDEDKQAVAPAINDSYGCLQDRLETYGLTIVDRPDGVCCGYSDKPITVLLSRIPAT